MTGPTTKRVALLLAVSALLVPASAFAASRAAPDNPVMHSQKKAKKHKKKKRAAKPKNGVNGRNGTNGVNGLNGAPGLQGPAGANGLDGAPGITGVTDSDSCKFGGWDLFFTVQPV